MKQFECHLKGKHVPTDNQLLLLENLAFPASAVTPIRPCSLMDEAYNLSAAGKLSSAIKYAVT